MRVVAEINHPACKISVFYMNQKYIIKVEKDSMEQSYKLSEFDYFIKDVNDVTVLITDEFIAKCIPIFEKMKENEIGSFDSIRL